MKSSYLLNENSTFQIVEAYKVFRTNLIFSLPIEGCKTILITSSQPADGKSVNCVNIAISFAQTGAKVLIIDSPPINMVADASILSRAVDGVVFIVREKYTDKKATMQSIKQLSFAGANMLGFLLNGAEIQERNYGNYGKYKYSSYK